jgi:hypothetical protein
LTFDVGTTVYFKKAGSKYITEVLKIAKDKADQLSIKNIVLSSTTGKTGVKASEVFRGYNLVVVTLQTGYRSVGEKRPFNVRGPNVQPLTKENRKKIIENGGKILTCVSPFSGVEEAVRRKFGTTNVGYIAADILRIWGDGMKVACEVSMMAADAGFIRTDEDAIAMGGTTFGVDTAILLRPVNTHKFFDLDIKEILCRPRKHVKET